MPLKRSWLLLSFSLIKIKKVQFRLLCRVAWSRCNGSKITSEQFTNKNQLNSYKLVQENLKNSLIVPLAFNNH